jgi:hypothetical protein
MPMACRESINIALTRLGRGLDQYLWIQRCVHGCDVSSDREFQRRFNAFYRVRRAVEWRIAFFRLLERSKAAPMSFPDALRALYLATNRVEASFASKLVATLDPGKPVIDRFVLANFGLRLPAAGGASREERIVQVYDSLRSNYDLLLRDPIGALIIDMFDQRYPNSPVSQLKKVDLVLWQIRS